MMRNAMIMAVTVGTLCGFAGAQVSTLSNGGFETPSNLGGGSVPLGWQNPDVFDTVYRRVGDELTPAIQPVGTAGAITPHSGERLMEFRSPAGATDFRALSTDLRDFFSPGFPFFDVAFDYNGGAVVVEGYYLIPADNELIGQVAGIKLNAKGAGDVNQDNATLDPWNPLHRAVTISGHTNGEWHLYRAVFCMDDLQTQVADNVAAGHFQVPPNPNRIKITIGRWSPDEGPVTGTIFWDDISITQLGAAEPCPEPHAGPVGPPSCRADFNGDTFVNPDDLADFITCFFLDIQFPGFCGAADFNQDESRDPDDLADFITTFFLAVQFGC